MPPMQPSVCTSAVGNDDGEITRQLVQRQVMTNHYNISRIERREHKKRSSDGPIYVPWTFSDFPTQIPDLGSSVQKSWSGMILFSMA